jgi:hypothetical protein
MSRVYETAIKIGATISKAFGRTRTTRRRRSTKLAAATKQLKQAEKSAAAFKKLDAEVTRSKGRYDVATSALRKLEEAERAAGGATKESTKWRKAGAREVAAAARQLDRASKAAQKNGEVLKKLGVDTSHLTSEQERLARALAATERQEKALERYEHSRERLFGKRKEREPLFAKGKRAAQGHRRDRAAPGRGRGDRRRSDAPARREDDQVGVRSQQDVEAARHRRGSAPRAALRRGAVGASKSRISIERWPRWPSTSASTSR